MAKALKYTSKVWLTTVFGAPIEFLIVSYINDRSMNCMSAIYFFSTTMGIIFSLFTAITFLAGVYYILKWDITTLGHRIAIQLLGLLLVAITFAYPVDVDTISDLLNIPIWLVVLPYILCLSTGIHLYKPPNLIYHQENSTI